MAWNAFIIPMNRGPSTHPRNNGSNDGLDVAELLPRPRRGGKLP